MHESAPDATAVLETPAQVTPVAVPVADLERLPSLDILRGVALLGILIMNILAFGLPLSAEFNPTVMGGSTGADFWAYASQVVLFDGKMRGIFSMIFGAGAYLLITRGELRGTPVADVFYRRTLWLMLFGLVHAFGIWWGDILFAYGLLGLLLYPLRKLSVKALLIIVGIQFAIMSGGMLFEAFDARSIRDKAAAIEKIAKAGTKLTEEQEKDKKAWDDKLKDFQPPKDKLDKELKAHRGNWLETRKFEAGIVRKIHGSPIYSPGLWDMLGMMLLGIALTKTGVLTGERTTAFYIKLAANGYAIGLPIGCYALWGIWYNHFDFVPTMFALSTYEVSRLAMTLGHVGLILLIARAPWAQRMLLPFRSVGQMAFTNYIATSLICTTIFYGFGFGLYGKLARHQLYYVVLAVWIPILIWSPLWMARFRFGPLEWCWRSLTYWRKQPMKRLAPVSPEPLAPPLA